MTVHSDFMIVNNVMVIFGLINYPSSCLCRFLQGWKEPDHHHQRLVADGEYNGKQSFMQYWFLCWKSHFSKRPASAGSALWVCLRCWPGFILVLMAASVWKTDKDSSIYSSYSRLYYITRKTLYLCWVHTSLKGLFNPVQHQAPFTVIGVADKLIKTQVNSLKPTWLNNKQQPRYGADRKPEWTLVFALSLSIGMTTTSSGTSPSILGWRTFVLLLTRCGRLTYCCTTGASY